MNYQFLCTTHAKQLASHLEATGPIWSSWMRQGEAAHKAGKEEQCVQFFGCAFDLAVLLVERFSAHGELDGQRHSDRLMQSATKLAESLARGGYLALRREYLDITREILHREQQRLPLLADRLPPLDESMALTLDAYSHAIQGQCSDKVMQARLN